MTGPAGSRRAAGWLRPVELCLAVGDPGPAHTWPHPAGFVWRRVGEDADRRRQTLEGLLHPDACVTTGERVFAVYRITDGEHRQTGVLADVGVEAVEAGRVLGHEQTRPDREDALLARLDEIEALIGPVALAHRPRAPLARRLDRLARGPADHAWTSADGAAHEVWIIEDVDTLARACADLDPLYVVDGHHRIAAVARRAAGRGGADAFLAAVFPANELVVRAVHRIVELDAGQQPGEILERLRSIGRLTPVEGPEAARPRTRRGFGVGLDGAWHRLEGLAEPDKVEGPYPDAQLLADAVLEPVLAVADLRDDSRVGFRPDLGALDDLDRRCRHERIAVFLLHPVSVDEVFAVADSGVALPPKTTWFQPKPIRGAVMPAARLPDAARRRGGPARP